MRGRLVAATLAVAAGSALVSCETPAVLRGGPTLVVADGKFGMQFGHAAIDEAFSSDDVVLCLDEAGSVTIEDVSLANPTGGLRLRRFSVQDDPPGPDLSYIPDAQTSLAEAGFPGEGPYTVTHVCPSLRDEKTEEPLSLLGLEFAREDPAESGPAYMTGLVVAYRTEAGRSRSAFVPMSFVLCPEGLGKRADCDVKEVRPPD